MKRYYIISIAVILSTLILSSCSSVMPNKKSGKYEVIRGRLSISLGKDKPEDSNWINPSKIRVILSRNETAQIPIEIYNGGNHARTFAITRRIPDFIEDSYGQLEGNNAIWINTSHGSLEIGAKEKKSFLLLVGTDKAQTSRKEAWISILDNENLAVRSELCLRCLIDSVESAP